MSIARPLAKNSAAVAQAVDTRALRNALGVFATGVTIITTLSGDGRPVGLTVNSFSSVSLDPPLVLWSLSRSSHSFPVFEKTDHFAVNVLGRQQKELALQFARSSADKFAGVTFSHGIGGSPLLPGTAATFQCRTVTRHQGGDHVIFIGAVEEFHHNASEPLLFSRGQFGAFIGDV